MISSLPVHSRRYGIRCLVRLHAVLRLNDLWWVKMLNTRKTVQPPQSILVDAIPTVEMLSNPGIHLACLPPVIVDLKSVLASTPSRTGI
jgi:hypothetical protein